MSRNSPFFRKRPKSLIRAWLGSRKARNPSKKITNSLFRSKSKNWKGKTIYDKG